MRCHMLYLQTIFVLVVPILLQFRILFPTAATWSGNETDYLALLAFKSKIVHDPKGAMHSWSDSIHFCNWQGVTCGKRHQRVTILDLQARRLVGFISPYIGNLSFLRVLRLNNNTFQGEIPPQVGNLFRLQELSLYKNSLTGEIPANLSHCSNLWYFRIAANKLVGKLPTELSSLSKLIRLTVGANNFSGDIPSFIGNFTSLEVISADDNAFTGSIPEALGQLQNLNFLALGINKLSGKIPLSIYNLSSLTVLNLIENQLSGNIPSELGSMFPQLQHLGLSHNHLTGPLPVSLPNFSNMEHLELSGNHFSGKISIDFRLLPRLNFLNLANNNLGTGEPDEMNFIPSLVNCTNLQALGVAVNQLKGSLPKSIGNLSATMSIIAFHQNHIYGEIPSEISHLVGLTLLGLAKNELKGRIPSSIGNLQNLLELYLDSNWLEGDVPNTIGNLSSLTNFYLDNNILQGKVPVTLGNCQRLLWLNLSFNNLTGAIPRELFGISTLSISLNLAGNHFSGHLPLEVGNLKILAELDVSQNDLSDELPTTLGSCNSLVALMLQGNSFKGSVPLSFQSLRGLSNLDLSRNNLSGQIPKYLAKLSFNNLNLSFNDFEGEVPIEGVFLNATVISILGNPRLCGGVPELDLPTCTMKQSKKYRTSLKIILLFSIPSVVIVVIVVSSIVFCCSKKKNKDLTFNSLSMNAFDRISYDSLLKATEGFSSTYLIGMGNSGSVYKAILGETTVAVKVLNLQRQGVSRSFMAECKALGRIRHRNLIKILTSCSSVDFHGNDFKAIVYEFMPRGSLERWLHPDPKTENCQDNHVVGLTLLQRINVAIHVASALEYLHHHCHTPIIHCDLKPSNILLDADMVAHVGDFGLARLISEMNPNQSSSVGVRGTIGYAAPEYGLGSEVSRDGDVYSFGILLLELMIGKRPTESMFEAGLNLHTFARMAIPDHVKDIVDPKLLCNDEEEVVALTSKMRKKATTCPRNDNYKNDCLIRMIKIGVACSVESPQDRLDISNVVRELNITRDIFQGLRKGNNA
ncbi:putative receptor-like protein kinase At3g47110 [Diospyros lotus]|uniref:putative receptor-like protein kinase At3g47110 n=1 Tax=Diospyros lotus TaxID=55363 RepID=UPI002252B546|nr:putative receptor-like protein kinase At3g47110 [Diospyros lotus]XP_052181026.1 putative receptor-like protein kinase At3g47110 [Diospyros lotus]